MWHAALLLLIFSVINLAATPFLLAAIGQAAPALSFLSAACAAGMTVRAKNDEFKFCSNWYYIRINFNILDWSNLA